MQAVTTPQTFITLPVLESDLRERGISRLSSLMRPLALEEVLDREIPINLRDHNIPVQRRQRPVHNQDVTVVDAGPGHGGAAYFPEEGGSGMGDQQFIQVLTLDGEVICRGREAQL
jgi:hypothetical protein